MLRGMPDATFWTPKRKRFWTLAGALIALVALGVLGAFLIASRPDLGPQSAGKGELAAYLSDEHRAAFRDGTRLDQKFTVTDAAGLATGLQSWIGNSKGFEEVLPGGGVTFLGAGRSAVPGAGESAHLRLSADTGGDLSLFIKQYRQLPKLEEGSYTLKGRGASIEVWRRGGLVYYLVANTPEGLGVLRTAMGAPMPNKPY
jgi:hypothetical protein